MKCSWKLLLLLLLLEPVSVEAQSLSIRGYVEDLLSGERIPRVNLYLIDEKTGTSTNEFGYFNLNVPNGITKISLSHIVYAPEVFEWLVQSDTTLVIQLEPRVASLDSVIVIAEATRLEKSIQMSRHNLTSAEIESMPAILGEEDVIKALQLLPGVKPGREGFNAFHVRGGGSDQNLVLLDGLTLYNPSHVLGLFSVFNSSALKQIELLKGGFPARYGGRLSSVIQLTMKEGNVKRFGGEGKLGLLTSRLMIEGPIVQDQASWIISGRRTFLDQIARWFQPENEQTDIYFYDLNFKANYRISKRDQIYLSGYRGGDAYAFRTRPTLEKPHTDDTDFSVDWRNQLISLRWNRLLSDRIFVSVMAGIVKYDLKNQFTAREADPPETYHSTWESSILDYTARVDVEYNPRHHYFRFGAETTSHLFIPSSTREVFISGENSKSMLPARPSSRFKTGEFAVYVEDDVSLLGELEMNLGLRFSGGQSDGYKVTALEPRASLTMPLTARIAMKASYAFMQQYMHFLTGTGSALSRETWIPFMPGLDPQQASQVALGITYQIPRQSVRLTLEGYYKHLENQIEYRPEVLPYQAIVLGWPNAVERGEGRAYGMEFLMRRQQRRLHGWFSYTWSQSRRLYAGLNDGQSYPDGYDRTHDLSLVTQYQLTAHTLLSASWVYSSGYPIWLPVGRYHDPINHEEWFEYGSMNRTRVPATHRLDLTAQFVKQINWGKRTFSVGLFNVYNRSNPMYVYPDINLNGVIQWKRRTLLQLVPDFSYGIRF